MERQYILVDFVLILNVTKALSRVCTFRLYILLCYSWNITSATPYIALGNLTAFHFYFMINKHVYKTSYITTGYSQQDTLYVYDGKDIFRNEFYNYIIPN